MASERRPVKIQYINNDGGGFSEHIEVPEGTTVLDFFNQKTDGVDPKRYIIRVNRQAVAGGTMLQEGDRVSFTPSNIKGACV